MKPGSKYHFLILFSVTLLLACAVAMTSTVLSVFIPYIKSELSLSNTQASSITTIRSFGAAVFILFVDKYIKRFGLRRAAFIGTLILAAAFFLFGVSRSYLPVCIASLLTGFGNSACGIVVCSIIVYKWFDTRKDFFLSIASMGSGFAGILCPPVVTHIIETRSLAASLYFMSILIIILGAVTLVILRDSPEEYGIKAYNDGARSAAKSYGGDASSVTMTCCFIAVFLIGLTCLSSGTLSASLYRSVGFDPYIVSFAVSSMGIAIMISKIIFGVIVDRKGSFTAYCVFCICFSLGQIFNCLANLMIVPLMFAGTFLGGMGTVLSTLGITTVSREFSSEETFTGKLKNFQFVYTIGGACSGLYVGTAADITGAYVRAWYGILIMTLVMFALVITAFRKR